MKKVYRFLLHKCITRAIQSKTRFSWHYVLPSLLKLDGVQLLLHPKWIYDNYGVNSCIAVSYSSTKSINLRTKDQFLKIPLTIECSRRLAREWENLEAIKENEKISGFFESKAQIERYDDEINILRFPVLENVSQQRRDEWLAAYISDILTVGQVKKAIVTEDMMAGFNSLEKLVSEACREEMLSTISQWPDYEVSVGFTHGDLHKGNVMQENGQIVLIDPDRVDFNGIQEFDVVHILLSYYLETKREFWADTLAKPDCLLSERTRKIIDIIGKEHILDKAIMKAYFLDRAGKETRHSKGLEGYKARLANSTQTLFGGESRE